MMLRNPRESWGGVAKTLHWSAAALVLAMLGLGLTMVHGDLGAGAKFEAYQLHKSTGFLVLAVIAGARPMAHRKSPARAPGWDKALGTAARTGSASRLLCPHRGDDRIGLAHGLGVAAAASSAPSRRLRRAQSHRPECAAAT
jgi:hypothetical protein